MIAESLHAGIPALNGSPATNAQLAPTAQALVDFQESPGVLPTLGLLTDTNKVLGLGAALHHAVADRLPLPVDRLQLIDNASSQGNQNGHWLNFISFIPPEGPNAESGSASAPANGGGPRPKENHLHYNPLPRTAAPGQDGVCEAGNEKYAAGQTIIGHAPEPLGHEHLQRSTPRRSRKREKARRRRSRRRR